MVLNMVAKIVGLRVDEMMVVSMGQPMIVMMAAMKVAKSVGLMVVMMANKMA